MSRNRGFGAVYDPSALTKFYKKESDKFDFSTYEDFSSSSTNPFDQALATIAELNDNERLEPVSFLDSVIEYVPHQLESFATELVSAFQNLADKRYNWDKMGAPPLDKIILRTSLKWLLCHSIKLFNNEDESIIPLMPKVYARPKGSVDLLWEIPIYTLYLNIGDFDGVVKAMFCGERKTGKLKGEIVEATVFVDGNPRDSFISCLRNVALPLSKRDSQ